MNDEQFDDFLQLQLQGSSPYLNDGDFSARVIASLPAQKRLNRWIERLIVSVPVSLIALLVLNQFSLRGFIQPVYAWVLTVDAVSLLVLAMAMALVMLVVPFALALKRPLLF